MSDLLVLMRHGKAQRPTDEMLDMERKLTEAGKRSLVASLPYALGLMPRKTSMQVWSSPAARAPCTFTSLLATHFFGILPLSTCQSAMQLFDFFSHSFSTESCRS